MKRIFLNYLLKYLFLAFGVIFVCGCGSTKYMARQQYLLSLPEKQVTAAHNLFSPKYVVLLAPVVVVAPFDQLDFLYCSANNQYIIDYYHGFLVSPHEQLTALLQQYFQGYGNFSFISVTQNTTMPKLQVSLLELYADYRERTEPRGVIALRFLLTQNAGKETVIFDKVLRKRLQLITKDTPSLLQAWNAGLVSIYARALKELQQALSVTNK